MIQSHVDTSYVCPICLGVQGIENDKTLLLQQDVIFENDMVMAFINSFFIGKNTGHVIVVPKQHYENVYELPQKIHHAIADAVQLVAIAMKRAYECDGITTRQNNEPAGDQHAFHHHHHVFPRYDNDTYNSILPADKRLAAPEERQQYAAKMRTALTTGLQS